MLTSHALFCVLAGTVAWGCASAPPAAPPPAAPPPPPAAAAAAQPARPRGVESALFDITILPEGIELRRDRLRPTGPYPYLLRAGARQAPIGNHFELVLASRYTFGDERVLVFQGSTSNCAKESLLVVLGAVNYAARFIGDCAGGMRFVVAGQSLFALDAGADPNVWMYRDWELSGPVPRSALPPTVQAAVAQPAAGRAAELDALGTIGAPPSPLARIAYRPAE